MDGRTLLLLLSTKLEVLATSNVLHLECAALFAFHLQSNLFGNLRLLVENWLRLTTKARLLTVVTTLTLSIQ